MNNAAIIGSILGQLSFGLLGDLLGRKMCFVASSMMLIFGCLGSATAAATTSVSCALNAAGLCGSNSSLPSSVNNNVYLQLAIWRGILGFGVGGEYPLASTITSEGSSFKTRGTMIAMMFSMQGWGKLAGSIMVYSCFATTTYFGGTLQLNAAWRVVLACGCIPNILTLYFRWRMHESKIYNDTRMKAIGVDGEHLMVVVEDPKDHHLMKKVPLMSLRTVLECLWEFKWRLLGTGGAWFLLDFTFYGQVCPVGVSIAVRPTSHARFPPLPPPPPSGADEHVDCVGDGGRGGQRQRDDADAERAGGVDLCRADRAARVLARDPHRGRLGSLPAAGWRVHPGGNPVRHPCSWCVCGWSLWCGVSGVRLANSPPPSHPPPSVLHPAAHRQQRRRVSHHLRFDLPGSQLGPQHNGA